LSLIPPSVFRALLVRRQCLGRSWYQADTRARTHTQVLARYRKAGKGAMRQWCHKHRHHADHADAKQPLHSHAQEPVHSHAPPPHPAAAAAPHVRPPFLVCGPGNSSVSLFPCCRRCRRLCWRVAVLPPVSVSVCASGKGWVSCCVSVEGGMRRCEGFCRPCLS